MVDEIVSQLRDRITTRRKELELYQQSWHLAVRDGIYGAERAVHYRELIKESEAEIADLERQLQDKMRC